MDMERKFLKLLLDHAFFEENKGRISRSMFPDELGMRDLFDAVAEGHKRYNRDLKLSDLRALYKMLNPAATAAARNNVESLLEDLEGDEEMDEDVAHDVLSHMFRVETGRQIADLGLAIMDGKELTLQNLLRLVENTQDDFLPAEESEAVTTDLDELLEEMKDRSNWQFNVPSLHEKIPQGIGPGELLVILARPDVGKTGWLVNAVAGPGGYAEQGARVAWFGNEEPMNRTAFRCVMASSGMTRDQLYEDPSEAKSVWSKIKDNLILRDATDYSIEQLDAYCRRTKPDVLIVDQLDKIHIGGAYDGAHDKLRAIYTTARDIAKRHKVALIGVSQASYEAEGKTQVTYSHAEGSRTGKGAEADIVMGIGKQADSEDNTRFLHMSKNKISGFKGTVACLYIPDISRYKS